MRVPGITVDRRLPLLLCSLLPGLLGMSGGAAEAPAIRNPYYEVPAWKIWDDDDRTPVTGPIVYKRPLYPQINDPGFDETDFGHQVLKPIPPAQRLYPNDGPTADFRGDFLKFRREDWPGRKYAGF